MTPEAEALAEEISAIIEAKMKVAWQEAEPAANAIAEEFARRLRPRVDELSDEQCEAIYHAVSRANITRDVKTSEMMQKIVRRAALTAALEGESNGA